jgi:hypothetical protein
MLAAAPMIKRSGDERIMDNLLFIGVLVLWMVLQMWLLPKLGVPT